MSKELRATIRDSDSLSGILDSANSNSLYGTLNSAKIVYEKNYENLKNKPSINDVELIGNKSFEDLGDIPLSNIEILNMYNHVKGL